MSKTGFTLIELLVVISIISLITSIVMTSLNNAKVNTRDTARVQAFIMVADTIVQYHAITGELPGSGGKTAIHPDCVSNDFYTDLQSEGLLINVPQDPIHNLTSCSSNGDNTTFHIGFDGSAANEDYCLGINRFENISNADILAQKYASYNESSNPLKDNGGGSDMNMANSDFNICFKGSLTGDFS